MNSPEMADRHAATRNEETVPARGDAVAARAYENWMARDRMEGANCQDSLEAEAGLLRACFGAGKHAARRLVAEHAVTRILAESAEIVNAAPRIMQAICEGLGWDFGLVWTVDRDANLLRCVDVWQTPTGEASAFAQASRERTFAEGFGLPGRVWRNLSPVWIPEVTHDADFLRATAAVDEGLHGAYGFPIHDGAQFLGVMEFFSREMLRADEPLIEMMAAIGGQIAQFLDRRRAEQTVRERDREFALARQIQQDLLPKTMPVLPGFEFAGVSQSCQETGGDYYDFLSFGDATLGIAIGDASGHGIGAALVMAETRASLRALALTHGDPGTILTFANQCVAGDLHRGRFVTMFLARLDPGTRTLVYCSAGHPPGYVLDQRGEVRLALHRTGIPLGIDVTADFPSAPEVTLLPGDLLLLSTDGVEETFSPARSLFGIERMLDAVRAHQHERASEILEVLYRTLAEFSGSQSPLDDVTAVIVKVGPDV